MKRICFIGALALLFVGCHRREQVLGHFSNGPALAVGAAKLQEVAEPIVLHGTMTAKCPVAGCWFMLRDETGVIKVDTKNANFVVLDVPIHTQVFASGRVVTNGSERLLDATGIRY